ncbi:protein MULTIPOLAR SPINDLE 1 isoform X2 [Nymphaea colorata]|nr:protein MULTIPOLAR SPINDLE 1 isoform X2 [Nymphaea colorata]
MLNDVIQQTTYCKCYFFDKCGDPPPRSQAEEQLDGHSTINDVLYRRFLRQARKVARGKISNLVKQGCSQEPNRGSEMEKLCTSADFLLELVNNRSIVETGSPFATLAHQSLEFILASVKVLLLENQHGELLVEILNSLITHLLRGMCIHTCMDGTSYCDPDTQFHVQHLIRKLGVEPYIAQRTLLLVAQRVCALADSLHCMDPFDSALPNIHDSMFMMLRLMEFLVSDYVYTWITNKDSEKGLFEETLRWIVQSKKSLTLLDNTNCLYMIQLDRVIGELAKQVGRVPRTEIEKLVNMEILESMFH